MTLPVSSLLSTSETLPDFSTIIQSPVTLCPMHIQQRSRQFADIKHITRPAEIRQYY